MLSHLSIRDVVLIEQLELQFQSGLSVLTGETGAGKSILLDALGLAIGTRAEARLVRQGADRATVSATFEVSDNHPIRRQLADHGINTIGEPIILRRVLNTEGRSRAFANDQAISVGLLNEIGGQLVEVHGQFDNQRLMRPDSHRSILDSYAGSSKLVTNVLKAYRDWKSSISRRETAIAETAAAKRDEEFLRSDLKELIDLSPRSGEAAALSDKRKLLMNSEKLIKALSDAQSSLLGEIPIDQRLQCVLVSLENANTYADKEFNEVISSFEAALTEILEGLGQLDRLSSEIRPDASELELTEERLFALRAIARKHQVEVDDLGKLEEDFRKRLNVLEDQAFHLAELERDEIAARETYIEAASRLRELRKKYGKALEQDVNAELSDLKLERARFYTQITHLKEQDWNTHGMDQVSFLVSMNPDSQPGPVNKIISGGELARLMLALKAVLAVADPISTLIFDEVDAGVGGAVAAAVGDRLVLLGQGGQVLVVTHSPQVAAKGDYHWLVRKLEITPEGSSYQKVSTTVEVLDAAAREEEIARMLAGAQVTDEARAAADRLLAGDTR